MAKNLDICYVRTSQQLQKLFSITHLKKSLNMSNSSRQLNWIVDISFFSFAFATEMAMHWMKLVSTMITFVNPVSFVPWATLKKSEKQSRNWISSKWRQNGLIQHLREKFLCLCTSPPVPSLGLVVFVILFLEDKDFMVTKMWLLKMNPTFYYKLWTKRTRKLCDNISKDRSIKHKF